MALNTSLGWSSGDDIRLLVAAGLPVGLYQIEQVQKDMNYIGGAAPSIVGYVLDLLDQFEAAQTQLSEFNSSSESRILTKVDVLEWKVSAPGTAYSPEREIERIRGLLYQYFASSVLFNSGSDVSGQLIRS